MIDLKWHKRFLEIAQLVSTWSKDPSSKIGAVFVDKNRRILSTGYNGFPIGIDDDDRLNTKEEKYDLIIHAEMNGIYNATMNGISLKDSTLYVYGLPVCHNCAKGVIQSGVKSIYMPIQMNIGEKWKSSWEKSNKMFLESGVSINFI